MLRKMTRVIWGYQKEDRQWLRKAHSRSLLDTFLLLLLAYDFIASGFVFSYVSVGIEQEFNPVQDGLHSRSQFKQALKD